MDERGFANCLQAILTGECDLNESFDPDGVRDVATFEEAGLLTRNRGLVVTMDDGAEYQITIVRSRSGRDETLDDDDNEEEECRCEVCGGRSDDPAGIHGRR